MGTQVVRLIRFDCERDRKANRMIIRHTTKLFTAPAAHRHKDRRKLPTLSVVKEKFEAIVLMSRKPADESAR